MSVLAGVRVLELAGIGPAPFGVQVLADFGADVLRVDRPLRPGSGPGRTSRYEILSRGRRSIALDLKQDAGKDLYLRLVENSDVVVDPYRAGATDRLGIGAEVCRRRNDALVYAHLTGWGLTGPLADRAGHDVNYLAISGILEGMGYGDRPPLPPINYLADFAAGGLNLVIGVLLALLERTQSGLGQEIDVAMVDGAAAFGTYVHGLRAQGLWSDVRFSNELDGGAHYYTTYETADGRYLAVAPIEAQFYTTFLERMGLEPDEWPQSDPSRWPELRERLAAIFRTRTRDEWSALLEDHDACVSPVLTLAEAPLHPHAVARRAFVGDDPVRPAGAPRLARTPARDSGGAPRVGEHSEVVVKELGLDDVEVASLKQAGVIS